MPDEGNSFGLLIPIAVLLIVMFGIGERWLLVPIVILSIIFVTSTIENRRIKSRERLSKPVVQDIKPIYDQKKRKKEGVTCGTFIPIIILGWLYLQSFSWIFLIPLFILTFALLETLWDQASEESQVRQELHKDTGSISDISDRTGLPKEKVRQHIVTEKRRGSSDVWFDSTSGEMTSTPVRADGEPAEKKVGCSYCGFALKSEDRFCPFCGAPIRA